MMKKLLLMVLLFIVCMTTYAGDDSLNYRVMPENPNSSTPVFLEIEWFSCGGITVNDVNITGLSIAVEADPVGCPVLQPPLMSWIPVELGVLPAGDYLLSLNFDGQTYQLNFTVRGSSPVAVNALGIIGLAMMAALMLSLVWFRK